MLAELRLLLAACPAATTVEEYGTAIIVENVLLKRTDTTRRESFRRLRELYSLDPRTLLFRALRDLWDADEQAQPLVAALCANARDPILRATADLILSIPPGAPVRPEMIADATKDRFPGRYNPTMLANVGRNAASSWQQSGHLSGRTTKVRARAVSRPSAVAYALLLGHLADARGEGLFHTLWARLLDAPEHVLHELAVAASQRGWIEYRRSGGVTEVGFRYLLRTEDGRGVP